MTEETKNRPALSAKLDSGEAVLWETKAGSKVDFSGNIGATRVVGKIVQPKEGDTFKPFISLSAVEGEGEAAKFKKFGTMNVVNHVTKDGVKVPTPEGNVRRVLLNDGSDKVSTLFIGDGLSDETFAKMGFTGTKTTHKEKVEEAASEAAASPAP